MVEDNLRHHELPEKILGDQIRLKQVLINLIINVMKSSPGGASIRIMAAYDEIHQLLKVNVTDFGNNIADHAFKFFLKTE